jgi:hypothetical protein
VLTKDENPVCCPHCDRQFFATARRPRSRRKLELTVAVIGTVVLVAGLVAQQFFVSP